MRGDPRRRLRRACRRLGAASKLGIPPPGVLSDFYGFFWCDAIVAISLVTVVTVYLRRGTE